MAPGPNALASRDLVRTTTLGNGLKKGRCSPKHPFSNHVPGSEAVSLQLRIRTSSQWWKPWPRGDIYKVWLGRERKSSLICSQAGLGSMGCSHRPAVAEASCDGPFLRKNQCQVRGQQGLILEGSEREEFGTPSTWQGESLPSPVGHSFTNVKTRGTFKTLRSTQESGSAQLMWLWTSDFSCLSPGHRHLPTEPGAESVPSNPSLVSSTRLPSNRRAVLFWALTFFASLQ